MASQNSKKKGKTMLVKSKEDILAYYADSDLLRNIHSHVHHFFGHIHGRCPRHRHCQQNSADILVRQQPISQILCH